jgi:hypothetical protein
LYTSSTSHCERELATCSYCSSDTTHS